MSWAATFRWSLWNVARFYSFAFGFRHISSHLNEKRTTSHSKILMLGLHPVVLLYPLHGYIHLYEHTDCYNISIYIHIVTTCFIFIRTSINIYLSWYPWKSISFCFIVSNASIKILVIMINLLYYNIYIYQHIREAYSLKSPYISSMAQKRGTPIMGWLIAKIYQEICGTPGLKCVDR